MIGSGQASRHPTDQPLDGRGSIPRSSPWLTFGHEMFSSTAARPGVVADHLGHRDELVLVLAGDVGDDRRADRPEVGQVVAAEVVDAVVVEADGVEHARRPSRRSAASGSRRGGGRHGLRDHAAEPFQADEPGHLADIAERPRGHQHRVPQSEPSQFHAQIDHVPASLAAVQFARKSTVGVRPDHYRATRAGAIPRSWSSRTRATDLTP